MFREELFRYSHLNFYLSTRNYGIHFHLCYMSVRLKNFKYVDILFTSQQYIHSITYCLTPKEAMYAGGISHTGDIVNIH